MKLKIVLNWRLVGLAEEFCYEFCVIEKEEKCFKDRIVQ
jgi:hypothetical protein